MVRAVMGYNWVRLLLERSEVMTHMASGARRIAAVVASRLCEFIEVSEKDSEAQNGSSPKYGSPTSLVAH